MFWSDWPLKLKQNRAVIAQKSGCVGTATWRRSPGIFPSSAAPGRL